MPVALRLLDLLPPNYQPLSNANAPVPIQLLTITGSREEMGDLRNESDAFFKLFRDARRYEFRSETHPFDQVLADVIFAGYLSGMQLGDSYAEWALSRSQPLPTREYPQLYELASSYAKSIVEQPSFPVSGSIPISVARLAEILKRQKAYGFTALLLGGSIALGQPLSPFLVFESAVGGTASYFVVAVGTAAAERLAKFVRVIGEEKHRPELRQRRRRRRFRG